MKNFPEGSGYRIDQAKVSLHIQGSSFPTDVTVCDLGAPSLTHPSCISSLESGPESWDSSEAFPTSSSLTPYVIQPSISSGPFHFLNISWTVSLVCFQSLCPPSNYNYYSGLPTGFAEPSPITAVKRKMWSHYFSPYCLLMSYWWTTVIFEDKLQLP